MTIKIKAVTVYRMSGDSADNLRETLWENVPAECVDPSPTSWGSRGFAPLSDDLPVSLEVADSCVAFGVQFRERILPGAVIKEELAREMGDYKSRCGRPPSRKEIMQMKEDIAVRLLPGAFIRKTTVPCILALTNTLYVCSSSPKRVDDVLGVIGRAVEQYEPTSAPLEIQHFWKDYNPTKGFMLELLNSQGVGNCVGKQFVILENNQNARITFKDSDLNIQAVTEAMSAGYSPTQIAFKSVGNLTARLTDTYLIKSIKFSKELYQDEDSDVPEAALFLQVSALNKLVADLSEQFGKKVEDGDL
jgi:recombination associated protein RdgC